MIRYGGYIIICFFVNYLHAQLKQGKNYFEADSTKIKEIYHYSKQDSILQDSYESFYPNGSLNTYGWFKNNQPDSIWHFFYENGREKAMGRFKKGDPSGHWKYFYENGNVKSKGKLEKDSKEGIWKFYYENGEKKSSGKYVHNKKIGIWNHFFEDGSIKAQSIIENDIGYYVEFYPSGDRRMEGENENEKSIGEWIYYHESGKIEAIGMFENGLKIGEWKYYHQNDSLAGIGNYEKGVRTGKWRYYHQNGQLSQSGEITKNQNDGYWKLFYPSGKILGEVYYNKGSGLFKEYHPSGIQKSKGRMENGKKTGKWYFYREQGSLEGEANLINGKGDYVGYYLNGIVKMTGTIENDKRVGQWNLYNPDATLAGTYKPIYEDEEPIFKMRISNDLKEKESQKKPNYRPEKPILRYFSPKINEYIGIIVGVNPIWLLNNHLPVSIEYYIQERLGYEIQFDIIRSPFITPDSKIDDYQIYRRGAKIHFKQKFYHKDSKIGMFYFGHEVNYKYQHNKVNHTDTVTMQRPKYFGVLKEQSFGYSIFIGNRWMKDPGDSGPTIDIFIELGIAYRTYKKQYEPLPILDNYFDREIKSSTHFPITIGLNFGFASTKNKSKIR